MESSIAVVLVLEEKAEDNESKDEASSS